MPQALADLKVLEFGDFISAPYCGKLFADLGAEVVKIERPRLGDPARHHGPFLGNEPHPERSGLFLYLNTNKLGITLDPRTPSGRALFYRLVAEADILIENHLPREMAE